MAEHLKRPPGGCMAAASNNASLHLAHRENAVALEQDVFSEKL